MRPPNNPIHVENLKIAGVYSSRTKAEARARGDVGTDIVEWIVRVMEYHHTF